MVSAKFFIPLLILASACLVSVSASSHHLTAAFSARRQQATWAVNDKIKNGGAFLLDNELDVQDYLAVETVMNEMNKNVKAADKFTLCEPKAADFRKCYCSGWVAIANNKVEYNLVFRMLKNGKSFNMFLQSTSNMERNKFSYVKHTEFGAPFECRQPGLPDKEKKWSRYSAFSNLFSDPQPATNTDAYKNPVAGLALKEQCLTDINKVNKKNYKWIVEHNATSRRVADVKLNVDAKNLPAVWKNDADLGRTLWMIIGLQENNVPSYFLCIASLGKSMTVKVASDMSDLSKIPSPNAKPNAK